MNGFVVQMEAIADSKADVTLRIRKTNHIHDRKYMLEKNHADFSLSNLLDNQIFGNH